MYNTHGSTTGRFRTTSNGHVPGPADRNGLRPEEMDLSETEMRVLNYCWSHHFLKLPGHNRREQLWYLVVLCVGIFCWGGIFGLWLGWWLS